MFEPEIASNLGAVMRTCVALNAVLHVIHPCGFFIDDRFWVKIKRTSANYLKHLTYFFYDDYHDFCRRHPRAKIFYATRYSRQPYHQVIFTKDNLEKIFIMFGKESTGIPLPILKQHKQQCLRIPMAKTVRAMNVASTVAIIGFEIARQFNFKNMLSHDSFKDPDYL